MKRVIILTALILTLMLVNAVDPGFAVAEETSTADVTELHVGDIFLFGHYRQSFDSYSGNSFYSGFGSGYSAFQPSIEWEVLGKADDGSVLLISKYALNSLRYDENDDSSNWESCELREWLNGSFFNEAFSETERERIATVVFQDDMTEDAAGDKVFLFNAREASAFFASDEARVCQMTEYAHLESASDLGIVSIENHGLHLTIVDSWWLRDGSLVNEDGSIDESEQIKSVRNSVRPVIIVMPA